jgi:hypothetical protein
VIVEAETLTHARLLAVVNDLGRAAIDPDYEQMIPDDFIWRRLSRDEASSGCSEIAHDGPARGRIMPLIRRNSE